MLKKIIYILVCIALFSGFNLRSIDDFGKKAPSFSDVSGNFLWAKTAVDELSASGAVSGTAENVFSPSEKVSREQLAKMLSVTFDLTSLKTGSQAFDDVAPDRWSYKYISACSEFFPKNSFNNNFNPEGACLREDLAVACAKILNLSEESASALKENFADGSLVSPEKEGLFFAAAEAGILSGSEGCLYPKSELTRAEACVIIKRAADFKENGGKKAELTNKITGQAEISLSQAQKWAKSKNADERFIDIAPVYWEYGEKTGIRPEVLYAQAAKETNYGKYTGNVVPEQNNWAGIKTVTASGDTTFDHESFESPSDGVRGHFNHMCAYVGLAPLGEPHERFNAASSAVWAGKVLYIEELGGKWAPAADYGESILEDYLKPMSEA